MHGVPIYFNSFYKTGIIQATGYIEVYEEDVKAAYSLSSYHNCPPNGYTNKKRGTIFYFDTTGKYIQPKLINLNTARGNILQKNQAPFPRLFFKLNSTNFDTLSNYRGNDLHIVDTNQVIDYMVKYLLTNPNENIAVNSWVDVNEQNPEQLSKQRFEKVINLLVKQGVAKDRMIDLSRPPRLINTLEVIQNAPTEKEKEQLHKANRCVMFRELRG